MASNRSSFQSSTWDEQSPYKPTQWRSTVSAPSCALCQKAVFPAEEVIGAGQKYHKLCLKCSQFSPLIFFLSLFLFYCIVSCNTLLNSGNLNEHDKKIYCVACYRRQFGPHGSKSFLGLFSSLLIC